jgi:hypothetical protein
MPRKTAKMSKRSRIRLSQARFRELVEDATVDAWGESEQVVGWMTMIEENVGFPFESELLGVDVKVVGVDVTDASELVAVCRRGKNRLKIPLVDLPVPSPPPEGAEWVEAFRLWRKGRQ